MDIQAVLSSEFQTAPAIIGKIVSLIDEGNTIPFIARYRKEMTGAMDDQKLREISERLDYLRGLDKRREQIAASIAEQGKMTAELEKKLSAAATLSELEDIYRPYKQKRRTRAMIAKEKGVQPLADLIFAQRRGDDPLALAQAYVSEEKGVPDAETAVQLAQDILAEQISDDAAIRANLRALYRRTGVLRSVAAKEGESVYAQYADYREPVLRAAGHRILAINRGEREEWLKVAVECDDEQAMQIICRAVIRPGSACCDVVRAAAKDAWGRLISPSLEREIRSELTDKANEGAIRVFGDNLHQLLMQPPIRGKVTLGVDPGFRTGCKLAVVDETGRVLETGVGYFTLPNHEAQKPQSKSADFGHDPPPQGHGCRHRQRHGLPRERTVHRVPAAGSAGRGLRHRQRGGRERLLGFQTGGEGISGIRRFAQKRGFHRAAHAGPACRAGEDRPEGHRRGAVSARSANRPSWTNALSGVVEELRVQRRRGCGDGFRVAADACGGHRRSAGQQHCGLSGRKRRIASRAAAQKGAEAGAEGV